MFFNAGGISQEKYPYFFLKINRLEGFLLLIYMSENFLEKRVEERIRGMLRKETLLRDVTFSFACRYFPQFAAYIASVITGEEVVPRHVAVQERIMNPGGRDIIADVMVYDESGNIYDLEPNTYKEGSSVERGLFHSYLVGSKLLRMGEQWNHLRRGSVIMFNRHDVMGDNESVTMISLYEPEGRKIMPSKGMRLYMVHVSPNGQRGIERDDLLRDLSVIYAEEEMILPITGKIVRYILKEGVQEKMYEYMR